MKKFLVSGYCNKTERSNEDTFYKKVFIADRIDTSYNSILIIKDEIIIALFPAANFSAYEIL